MMEDGVFFMFICLSVITKAIPHGITQTFQFIFTLLKVKKEFKNK